MLHKGLSCPGFADNRECMLRYAHAARHGLASACASCSCGKKLMSRPAPVKKKNPPRNAQKARPSAPYREVPLARLRELVREMLPHAEACALGCASIGTTLGADAASIARILAAEGLTIFKNELSFMGRVQPCVSVNKRLRVWLDDPSGNKQRPKRRKP